ncbi:haloacid dehalogenase [Vibrio sp. MACH09]|uniref:HAD family hydrolase n=1 Tax=unclassified Vibrio TaxID=2614977 RepID=UPI001493D0F2|nr:MULTISPECIES: HAD family hydrolase [unclassified Vibrio]NOI66828.1 HAD family hydrolase [Vibrio sp. 99-8-1]GLO62880.1 haloacid dehalogenase [Vibrio sp. MACH09]
MDYQAFVFDLDGTLLSDDDQINEVNTIAIRSAIDDGYKIALASGRPHTLMQPYATSLGITEPLICCNGAYVYDPIKEQVIDSHPIEIDLLCLLLQDLDAKKVGFTIYSSRGVFSYAESNHLNYLREKASAVQADISIEVIADLTELLTQVGDVYKVLAFSDDKAQLCSLRDGLQQHLQADLSTPNKLDITSVQASKGRAVGIWLQQIAIPATQVVAFGDGDNDISMFDAVGEPVAMKNASPSLKRKANLIVTDNNGCGIGQYLRYITLENTRTYQPSY